MSKNVTVAGASYTDVPSVDLPKTGGGTASFFDVSDTTATASDVASGKIFYAADGTQTTGISSGGSSWTLIGSSSFTVNTTSTSAYSVGTVSCSPTAWDDSAYICVRIRDTQGKRAGYFYGSDNFFVNINKVNGSSVNMTSAGRLIFRYSSSSVFQLSTSTYGVYASAVLSNGSIEIYRRYSSSYSFTLNGTYTVKVYKLVAPDGNPPIS